MPFITEEQAKKRLSSPHNLGNRTSPHKRRINGPNNDDDQVVSIRPFNNGGRRDGDRIIPDELRQLAALTALDSNQRDAADLINVSVGTIAGYVKGNVGGKNDAALKSIVESKLEQAQELAVDKLLASIERIDFDNEKMMNKVDVRDMSNIASNLSRVIEKTRERTNVDDATRLILYAPEIKLETHYNTVEIYSE